MLTFSVELDGNDERLTMPAIATCIRSEVGYELFGFIHLWDVYTGGSSICLRASFPKASHTLN